MGLLDGKVAVVTGAGRGIGRSHALGLAKEGAAVLVNDGGFELREGEGGKGLVFTGGNIAVAQAVVDEIVANGGRAIADSTDVGNIERAASIVDKVIEEFGGIDILVNNAGTWNEASTFDIDEARFDAEFATHTKGTVGTTRAAANAMRDAGRGGRIINTISGFYGAGGLAPYLAAKTAVASFTLTAAAECKEYGITVNGISPLAITRQSRIFFFRSGVVDKEDQATIDHVGPHQNTPLVIYLASEQAAHITGKLLSIGVDGFTADAPIRITEHYFTSTEGVAAMAWSPEDIGAAIDKILHN